MYCEGRRCTKEGRVERKDFEEEFQGRISRKDFKEGFQEWKERVQGRGKVKDVT
jgi:hypothetical protein